MSFNIKALAIVAAICWGGAFLLVGLANLIFAGYGAAFLELGEAIYPGYTAEAGFGSVIVVTLYALIDGAVCGAIFGWLYNLMTAPRAPQA
jgi:hypothetical protein